MHAMYCNANLIYHGKISSWLPSTFICSRGYVITVFDAVTYAAYSTVSSHESAFEERLNPTLCEDRRRGASIWM